MRLGPLSASIVRKTSFVAVGGWGFIGGELELVPFLFCHAMSSVS